MSKIMKIEDIDKWVKKHNPYLYCIGTNENNGQIRLKNGEYVPPVDGKEGYFTDKLISGVPRAGALMWKRRNEFYGWQIPHKSWIEIVDTVRETGLIDKDCSCDDCKMIRRIKKTGTYNPYYLKELEEK